MDEDPKSREIDLFFPCTYVQGEVVFLSGKQPSGQTATVHVNCLINSILMRQTFYALRPFETFLFDDYVTLVTYGDDNVMNVHKDAPWFNHTSISRYLATQGIGYTMAEKGAKSVPYIHIDEATFLKRRWRFDEDTQTHLAPLEEKSIWKMMMYGLPSKVMDERHLATTNLDTALRERFFYGREVFEKEREWTLSVVEELGLDDCVTDSQFPTYQTLFDAYKGREKEESELSVYDLQSGAYDICEKCGNCDCFVSLSDSVVCPRCHHCRDKDICSEDMFLGCFYCESEEVLVCDACGGPSIDVQFRVGTYHNLFFCYMCWLERRVAEPEWESSGESEATSPVQHGYQSTDQSRPLTRLLYRRERSA